MPSITRMSVARIGNKEVWRLCPPHGTLDTEREMVALDAEGEYTDGQFR